MSSQWIKECATWDRERKKRLTIWQIRNSRINKVWKISKSTTCSLVNGNTPGAAHMYVVWGGLLTFREHVEHKLESALVLENESKIHFQVALFIPDSSPLPFTHQAHQLSTDFTKIGSRTRNMWKVTYEFFIFHPETHALACWKIYAWHSVYLFLVILSYLFSFHVPRPSRPGCDVQTLLCAPGVCVCGQYNNINNDDNITTG